MMNTEIDVLNSITKHANIIGLVDYGHKAYMKQNGSRQVNYMVLDFEPNGELLNLITQNSFFGEDLSRHFFRQLL